MPDLFLGCLTKCASLDTKLPLAWVETAKCKLVVNCSVQQIALELALVD